MSEEPFPEELQFPEAIAKGTGMPVAFVRLAIDSGCPMVGDRVSVIVFWNWITNHYNEIRVVAGLKPLERPTSSDGTERARVDLRNGLQTMLDYMGSRSTNPKIQRAYREQSKRFESES